MKDLLSILLLLASMSQQLRIGAGETNYFLVGNWFDGSDSYVLPLSKPEDIAHARDLVALGSSVWEGPEPHQSIAVARIAWGRDGINRDYRNRTFPAWSWHVVEFIAFADLTAEILDGSPTLVEEGQHAGGGLIGFWLYTTVRELGPNPLYLSIVPDGKNLHVYWSGLGTNYLYTLESKELPSVTNWTPFPGVLWPLATNHWTVTVTNAPPRLYRVKAQQSGD